MKKWIEWKKREIYPEFVVQINCCTIERNDEHRNGVHRAIIEIQRGLSADVSNPSLPSHYHLYIGRVPEIYRYDKNFNDKIYSFIIANEKRIIQNWEIVPITALNEKEQDNARRVYKLWGNNSNSAQYQINQYISQLEEQEREEFQTQSIAEEQSPSSSPNPADPAQLQEAKLHDDEYYLSIQDHNKRRLQMRNDGIIPTEISRWEKQQNKDGKFKKSLPSTGIAAIKQSIQRAKKSNTK